MYIDTLGLESCVILLTCVRKSPYIFFVASFGVSNRLCLGRLAYSGYLLGLDKRVTTKRKERFVLRMYRLMLSVQ